MKILVVTVGVLIASLGALWLLQGLGIVHMRPILCFASCEPIQGASATWAVIGFVMAAAGVLAIAYVLGRR